MANIESLTPPFNTSLVRGSYLQMSLILGLPYARHQAVKNGNSPNFFLFLDNMLQCGYKYGTLNGVALVDSTKINLSYLLQNPKSLLPFFR